MVRRRRTGLRGLLGLVALVLLSGCLKLDADLAVAADDTVSGRYVVAYLKDPARPASGLAPPRELLVSRGSAESRRYDDGSYLGTEYELRGVSFSDLAAFAAVQQQQRQTGTLRLARAGDDVTLAGTFDFRETRPIARTAEQRGAAGRGFAVRVRLTFPGEVYAANGRVEGRSVTWDVRPFELTTLTARASALPPAPPTATGGAATGAMVGAGVSGLAVLLVTVLLLRRRRRPAAVAADPADATDFAWVLGERARPPADPPGPPPYRP